MNLKPITAVAAIAIAILMTAPASGQGLPLMASGGEESSWTSDGTTWTNAGKESYNSNECSFLDTPALPGAALAADPTMGFDYSFVLEYSSFSDLAYDGSFFLLSTDAGATWSLLETGMENVPNKSSAVTGCAASFGVDLPGAVIGNIGEGTASIDLSGVGPTDLFQVRLVLATDFCCIRDGWTVSGITVGGVPLA